VNRHTLTNYFAFYLPPYCTVYTIFYPAQPAPKFNRSTSHHCDAYVIRRRPGVQHAIMPHLEPAVQVDDDASDCPAKGNELKTRILVGVAHDTEMHDSATTTTTQTIPHPSQDLALESPQLPLPPHDIGTRSPPTLSSSSSSSSSSLPSVPSALPYSPPLQSLHNAVSEPANKQQEQACVTVAVHDLPNVNCAVGLSADANGNGRSSGMTDLRLLSRNQLRVARKTN